MFERELMKLLDEAKIIRQEMIENESATYDNDFFGNLSNFILKRLSSSLFRKKSAEVIANHFDEILPYIVMSNMDIILLNFKKLMEQPNFKTKFIAGLKKYPYANGIDQLFYNIWICSNGEFAEFNEFIDDDMLKVLADKHLSIGFYRDMLNRLNEDNQKIFLNLLVENKCDIPYTSIEYKGDNKQIIYDNLTLFTESAQNLYTLMKFVKDKPDALMQVKDYIDSNEEKAMNSIFCEGVRSEKIKDPTIKKFIELMILDVMNNEKVKFSDITYNEGGFSRVILIGDKVIKIGDRCTKSFPNNPYIIAPLLRREFEGGDEKFFIEVTERVDTSRIPSEEELYQLFKNLRNLGLKWTDIKEANVGRLNKKNVIHWKENIEPSEEILGLDARRGTEILDEGDLVILDADFIYDENDPNIEHTNRKYLYSKFEERYQSEKRKSKELDDSSKIRTIIDENVSDYSINENGIRR